jgi:UDP-glucose 4-epimerase
VRVDLTDTGQVLEAPTGVETCTTASTPSCIWRDPRTGLTTNGATFANNIAATHNVFAARRGDPQRRLASSETASGLPFGNRSGHDVQSRPAPYIPVDEEYPPQPNSTYYWSRRWRRDGPAVLPLGA